MALKKGKFTFKANLSDPKDYEFRKIIEGYTRIKGEKLRLEPKKKSGGK